MLASIFRVHRNPVHRLTVQYRMHPEIRAFPSARFYESTLADGPGTSRPAPCACFAALPPHPIFPPLLFLDVSSGAEVRSLTLTLTLTLALTLALTLPLALTLTLTLTLPLPPATGAERNKFHEPL